MPYYNMNYNLSNSAQDFVNTNWVYSHKTNFLKKQVCSRFAYLCLVPLSCMTSAIDTIIGLGAGIGVLCTLGKHKPTYDFASRHAFSSNSLVVKPYQNFLKMINPEVNFGDTQGFFVSNMIKSLVDVAVSCQESNNVLKRHVASRLTYAVAALACLVTRAIDGVISIPVTALSILTIGKFQSINNLACRTLKAPGVINDLFEFTVRTINPWTQRKSAQPSKK